MTDTEKREEYIRINHLNRTQPECNQCFLIELLDTARADRDQLLNSLVEIGELIESGTLVRNTANDGSPDWMKNASHVVMVLSRAAKALDGRAVTGQATVAPDEHKGERRDGAPHRQAIKAADGE